MINKNFLLDGGIFRWINLAKIHVNTVFLIHKGAFNNYVNKQILQLTATFTKAYTVKETIKLKEAKGSELRDKLVLP